MLEAMIIRTNNNNHPFIDLKINDDTLVHVFTITGEDVKYSVLKHLGELVAKSTAKMVDIQEVDNHLVSMTMQTQVYIFEIRHGPDYTFIAYKILRH